MLACKECATVSVYLSKWEFEGIVLNVCATLSPWNYTSFSVCLCVCVWHMTSWLLVMTSFSSKTTFSRVRHECHLRMYSLCEKMCFWPSSVMSVFLLALNFVCAYVCVCNIISSKQLSVVDHIILHAVMDFTTELRCLAEHTHTRFSVCTPLYISLFLLCVLECVHTHIHMHRDSNYNRTHHSDRPLVFSLSKQITKTKRY